MKTSQINQFQLAYDVININGGAILGDIIFTDSSYDDFLSLRDSYSIEDPEINRFCVIRSVTEILPYSYDLGNKCEQALERNECYLIPAEYNGNIIIDIK